MSTACVSVPISWLQLEQRQLGELAEPQRRAVDQHLAECATCRACAERIARDAQRTLPPLPALPAPLAPARAAPPAPLRTNRRLQRLLWLTPALAASLLILLLPRAQPVAPPFAAARVSIKGGELALSLVREGHGEVTEATRVYASGDRLRVLVTCPPAQEQVTALVLQGASVEVPLSRVLSCGNAVVLGAFTLTGDAPATVCVALGAVDARSTPAALARQLAGRSACVALTSSTAR
ncbi:MAG: zf-HC2 domain-containing protein [Deltaproteobacteria bacterium]|nr:zf-HC2 domain-containing protein [Deltaproteobacteria bacterium]